MWDRVTGKHAQVRRQNEREAAKADARDRAEKDKLIFGQLDERRALHRDVKEARQRHSEHVAELHGDIAAYTAIKDAARSSQNAEIGRERSSSRPPRGMRQDRGPNRDR